MRYLSVVLFMCTLLACKREVIPGADYQSDLAYYPLQLQHAIEYSVDSVIYNTFSHSTQSVHAEYRDEVVDTFQDNLGRNSYRIRRTARADSNAAWQDLMVYYVTPVTNHLEVVEQNLRFIKLAFPVQVTTQWNGNIYLPAETSGLPEYQWYYDWLYRYSHLDETYNNGILDLPHSIEVSYEHLTNDSTNHTEYSDYTNYKEYYTHNIGLSYRELTHWEYQPTDGYRSGFSVVMRAKKYYP